MAVTSYTKARVDDLLDDIKTDVTGAVAAVAELDGTLDGVLSALAGKADTAAVTAALGGKADASVVAALLAAVANLEPVIYCNAQGVYPARSTVSSDRTRPLTWSGHAEPPQGNDGMVERVDFWRQAVAPA